VPEGTSIFRTYFAPADFMEAVNTIGLPLYAKMVVDDELQRWVKLHTQSNPLAMCLRPRRGHQGHEVVDRGLARAGAG
jgi:hypothetical protein